MIKIKIGGCLGGAKVFLFHQQTKSQLSIFLQAQHYNVSAVSIYTTALIHNQYMALKEKWEIAHRKSKMWQRPM